MQTLYTIIGRDALFLYDKEGTGYQRRYIATNPEFSYRPGRVKDDIKELLEILVDENNLENRSDLAFIVVGGEDAGITEKIYGVLEGNISDRYPLYSVLSAILIEFNKNEKLLTREFGINFDGINYRLVDGCIQKGDYNLLGYTIQADDLLQYIG